MPEPDDVGGFDGDPGDLRVAVFTRVGVDGAAAVSLEVKDLDRVRHRTERQVLALEADLSNCAHVAIFSSPPADCDDGGLLHSSASTATRLGDHQTGTWIRYIINGILDHAE